MVLEYLPQGSLEERLRDGQPLPDDETLGIAIEIAAGLAHAHERGLVHRDLKPANILFDSEGRAKIADFGIARMGGSGTLTEAGTVLGTASYISPEQATGDRPARRATSTRSGSSSSGCSPARCRSTRRTRWSSCACIETTRPVPSPMCGPMLRRDLPSIVTATLAKDPAARPADGAALLRELRAGGDASAALVAGAAPGRPLPPAATQVLRPSPSRSQVGPAGSRAASGRSRRRPPPRRRRRGRGRPHARLEWRTAAADRHAQHGSDGRRRRRAATTTAPTTTARDDDRADHDRRTRRPRLAPRPPAPRPLTPRPPAPPPPARPPPPRRPRRRRRSR